MKGDVHDPRGLIADAYAIEGITIGECRTIFLDWALGMPVDADSKAQVKALLVRFAEQPADHPMTQTLLAALKDAAPAKRRGGRAARLS